MVYWPSLPTDFLRKMLQCFTTIDVKGCSLLSYLFLFYTSECCNTESHNRFDARGSVHHSTILTAKNPTRYNSLSKFLLFLILNEAQHVSGDTASIIRSLKLHKQPLVLLTWKVVRRAVVGRCQVAYATHTLPEIGRAHV